MPQCRAHQEMPGTEVAVAKCHTAKTWPRHPQSMALPLTHLKTAVRQCRVGQQPMAPLLMQLRMVVRQCRVGQRPMAPLLTHLKTAVRQQHLRGGAGRHTRWADARGLGSEPRFQI